MSTPIIQEQRRGCSRFSCRVFGDFVRLSCVPRFRVYFDPTVPSKFISWVFQARRPGYGFLNLKRIGKTRITDQVT